MFGGWGTIKEMAKELAQGMSALDNKTLKEGVVVWFKRGKKWFNAKHKSQEFLLSQEKNFGDVEDVL
jgi:hypothetical protein